MKKTKRILLVLSLLVLTGCSHGGKTSTVTTSEDSVISEQESGTSSGETSAVVSSEISSENVSSDDGTGEPSVIYAAPDVEIKTYKSGTIDDPMNLKDAIEVSRKGSTIYLKDGTYKIYSPLMIDKWNEKFLATCEEEGKTLRAINPQMAKFDCSGMTYNSSNRGLTINSDYWHVYGLELFGAGDNGIYIGGNHNTIENCKIHDCSDTGLQLGRANSQQNSIDTWPSYNLIKNCTSYDNHDPLGEDSDGFACKLTTGVGNVFDGCIAYNNVDDGWDLYTKGDSGPIGPVTLKNCVSFNNGVTTGQSTNGKPYGTPNSDGNGFKLGGEVISVQNVAINCIAFNNLACGFTDNSNPGTIRLENCTSYNNGARDDDANNFDLCRNVDTSNNYFKGLLSYCDNNYSFNLDTNKTFNSKDQYKGTAVDSIFYYGKTMLKFEGVQECNYTSETLRGTIMEESECPFVSTVTPDRFADIHEVFRDDVTYDVKIGDFLKVKDSYAQSVFGKDVSLGADLA